MLTGEAHMITKYSNLTSSTYSQILKFTTYAAISKGLSLAFSFLAYCLAFWYGSELIKNQTINHNNDEPYQVGNILVVLFSIIQAGFQLGSASPTIKAIVQGKTEAIQVLKLFQRVPKINNPSNPQKIEKIQGQIIFQNVQFSYVEEQQILKNISLEIKSGTKVAFVGESGCGKSTVMQLLLRFYEIQKGQISIDGVNIKNLNIQELRNMIGYVGQEPVLFATSIKENLRYGKSNATDQELIEVLKKVNAWEFVEKMEHQLDQFVGAGGSQLSGGQKQRIAIARAILKEPKILLLDEATSALDRRNEIFIEQTLEKISEGMTTIFVAHRLSTIQNCEQIFVFENGQIVQKGNHKELIGQNGLYKFLVQKQQQQEKKNENEDKKENQIENKQADKKQNIVTDNQVSIDVNYKGDNEQQRHGTNIYIRLLSYNKNQLIYFILGMIVQAANGCVIPLFAYTISDFVGLLSQMNPKYFTQQEQQQQEYELYTRQRNLTLQFLVLAIVAFILETSQEILFGVVSEKLTLSLRQDVFAKLIKMPISYFDQSENSSGILSQKLSTDCQQINGLTSNHIGVYVKNISSFICGVTIGFIASWKLGFIVLSVSPLVFIGGIFQGKFMQGFSAKTDQAYKESGNIITEAVCNVRTLFSLANHDLILNLYAKKLQVPLIESSKKATYCGLAYGVSQMQIDFTYGISFIAGALLFRYDDLEAEKMFQAIIVIMFSIWGIGNSQQYIGDIESAKNTARNLFAIIDSQDEFQLQEKTQAKKLKVPILGNIEFKQVSFKYPSRQKFVLQNLNLKIQQGDKIALVGQSGSGKSSIISLLLRFYDLTSGEILIDGNRINDYDLIHLRQQIGLVSQEPKLFDGTILQNIQFNQQSKVNEIQSLTRQMNLFEGETEKQDIDLNKKVGSKGSQISGGQKQRIAIARSLLRGNNIYLFDEATSALDAQTENIVLQNLNQILKGKSQIIIAHRISTIKVHKDSYKFCQEADQIYYLEDGQIVEQGKYKELREQNGKFDEFENGLN